ncbi:hypothetical protein MTO96_025279 [Rhipicephalus appendiculatus]
MIAMKQVAVGIALLLVCLTGACRAQLKDGCKIETLRQCGDDFVPFRQENRASLLRTAIHGEVRLRPWWGSKRPWWGQSYGPGGAKVALVGPKLRPWWGLKAALVGPKLRPWSEHRQINCSLKFVDDCLKRLPKTAASLALKTLKEDIGAICTPGTDLYKAYQKAIGCMNTIGAKINACLKGLHGGLEKAVVKAPTAEVIHYACCSYGDVEDCLDKAMTQCESVGAKELTVGLLNHVFGETLSLVCDDYTRGSQACKSLPKLPPLSAADRKVENYLELLIEAANTIGRKH